MKIKFKNQEFQSEAVNAVIDVFEGQPYVKSEKYKYELGVLSGIEKKLSEEEDFNIGFRNTNIQLTDIELLQNIHKVQRDKKLDFSKELIKDYGRCSLDISMETGTGKTYVYIKTMFELCKRYGWKKFIIIVPNIAIKEGVLKNLKMTAEHFRYEYKENIKVISYNSNKLYELDDFVSDGNLSVLIINIQAFNKKGKNKATNKELSIIHSVRDDFNSRKPIDIIASTNPIIILDEPQRINGEATSDALKDFNPLFAINYSATHAKKNNLIYVLDTVDAYNKKIIKRIEVVGISLSNVSTNNGYVYLKNINIYPDKAPVATVEIEFMQSNGGLIRKTKHISKGSNLEKISGLAQYNGFIVNEIDGCRNTVSFINGVNLHLGEIHGKIDVLTARKIQIRETISTHFRKEEFNFNNNIKTLSLFFIDEVKNYRIYDEAGNKLLGTYGNIFEQEYKLLRKEFLNDLKEKHGEDYEYYKYLSDIDVKNTHNGYFSIDNSNREVNGKIDKSTDLSSDISAYELILRNKERLLSLDEHTRFIFSHSALREGWDNPNVFQICTLKDVIYKEKSKFDGCHQEIGRGLRLCVNGEGDRMDYSLLQDRIFDYNTLTIITSERYEKFIDELMSDIKTSLYERTEEIVPSYFVGKNIIGTSRQITEKEAMNIIMYLSKNDYIDGNYKVTNKFIEDNENEKLKPFEGLDYLKETVILLVSKSAADIVLEKNIGSATTKSSNEINPDNFDKFKDLWEKINDKFVYHVEFNDNDLVEKSVDEINRLLNVPALKYIIEVGSQKEKIDSREVMHGTIFEEKISIKADDVRVVYDTHKYDLIGEIVSIVNLSRKTVGEILRKIDEYTFNLFKVNPDEFISKAGEIILNVKADLITENIDKNDKNKTRIKYKKIEGEKFSKDIFEKELYENGNSNVCGPLDKHIKKFLKYDSKVELELAKDMDKSNDIIVYAKLPRAYRIPTPVGYYSPDWAILFDNKNVKHIYLVAESKGSTNMGELRGVERAKIACANLLYSRYNKTFIKYSVVANFDDLFKAVNK